MTPYTHTNSKGVIFYLKKQDVKLRGGKQTAIYYFTSNKDERMGELCELPLDRKVVENKRNGFLTIKTIKEK